jgi:hypothetical protein
MKESKYNRVVDLKDWKKDIDYLLECERLRQTPKVKGEIFSLRSPEPHCWNCGDLLILNSNIPLGYKFKVCLKCRKKIILQNKLEREDRKKVEK